MTTTTTPKFTYDLESLEDGRTIELISVGIVRLDAPGEYYAVNANMDAHRIHDDPWLQANVWPHLPKDRDGWLDYDHRSVRKADRIAAEVRDFLLSGGPDPELWAWYGAYDHVGLCQLWGRMIDLPAGLPMFTLDLKQQAYLSNAVMPEQTGGAHSALVDARFNRIRYNHLKEIGAL